MDTWTTPSAPPPTDACPTPYYITESEAEQLQVHPLLTLVSQALSNISSTATDPDGHQHFDRPITALIVAYARLPLRLYYCHCVPFVSWKATEVHSPGQLPPSSFVELLHHRLRHPFLSATECHSIECRARVAALPGEPQPRDIRRTWGYTTVSGPRDVWLEGDLIAADDDVPLALQPPFLLLFFLTRHMPTATKTYLHFHPSLAALRTELLARDADSYSDSPRRIRAKQVEHAEDEYQLDTWTDDPIEAEYNNDRNVDTLRLLRRKLRAGHVSLAFHYARHL